MSRSLRRKRPTPRAHRIKSAFRQNSKQKKTTEGWAGGSRRTFGPYRQILEEEKYTGFAMLVE